jgi:hypothetical protein
MGMIQGSRGRALVLTAALLASGGCAPFGDTGWGPRMPSARNVVLDGQVWAIDSRRGRIQLRSDRGRTNTIKLDRATRIVYRRRNYPVDALERGDLVRIWVEVGPGGDAWADRVEVRQSVRERYGDRYDGNGRDRSDDRERQRVERIEGRVGVVNLRDGYFTIDQGFNRSVDVYFHDEIDRDEYRRVERLRRGARIQAEVRPLSGNDVELVRLR